jgi:hypothetical protein
MDSSYLMLIYYKYKKEVLNNRVRSKYHENTPSLSKIFSSSNDLLSNIGININNDDKSPGLSSGFSSATTIAW